LELHQLNLIEDRYYVSLSLPVCGPSSSLKPEIPSLAFAIIAMVLMRMADTQLENIMKISKYLVFSAESVGYIG